MSSFKNASAVEGDDQNTPATTEAISDFEITNHWDTFEKTFDPFLASLSEMGHSLGKASQNAWLDSDNIWTTTLDLWQDSLHLWHKTAQAYTAQGPLPNIIAPEENDRRFQHPTWNQDPLFNAIKQSYLLFNRWGENIVSGIDNLDELQHKQAKFALRQMMDALSPSNFAWTNPDVINKTMESHGRNLLDGTQKFWDDWQQNPRLFHIRNTDMEAFQLGKNLATTPGKVVYQNELMQLIQYTPQTKTVFQIPLLIVPAWINKFYIFDLQDHNSFIKWALGEGYTIFIISWVNPDQQLSHKSFSDYMLEGPLTAIQEIKKLTDSPSVNAIGHCLGGILLSALTAYLGKEASKSLNSITLLTTLIDFSQAGDLLIFTNEKMVDALEKQLQEFGYLDGKTMAATFNLLRANDLLWSSFVNQYLLSKEAPAFDLLFWNSDSTNIPAKMYRFYMENMFQKNLLHQKNGLNILGRPIDLTTIETPAFILGTIEDHIAPWKSTFEAMNLFQGPKQYVLSESGHIAGVVNPVTKDKYGYWTGTQDFQSPEDWLQNAHKYSRSWWYAWNDWVKGYSGDQVDATGRIPSQKLEDAPGSYVQVRSV